MAGGFAGLAARGLGAVALSPSAARIGIKEGLTMLTLAFGEWLSHWPASPQVNDRKITAWRKENADRRRRKRTGKKRINIKFWGRRRNGPNDNFNWAV